MRTIVISGLSGAGKSSACKTLEDLGFYCIDNLPVFLLRSFFDLSAQSTEDIAKLALVIDARDKHHIQKLPQALETLKSAGHPVELVFLDAANEVLARRFSETRHRHPLSPTGTPLEGVQKERDLLAPIRRIADVVIDTSAFKPRDLQQKIADRYGGTGKEGALSILVTSFGFKYGLPVNADLLFDVRFLANPYFRDELKGKVGTAPDVIEFVMGQEDTRLFLEHLRNFLGFVVPRFAREGKSYLHVAVGCTGGRHRSVVIAGEITAYLKSMGFSVRHENRDMEVEA